MSIEKLEDDLAQEPEAAELEEGSEDESEEGSEDESGDEEAVSETDAASNVRHLLPVHAAPNTGKNSLKVKRGPGRPRKVIRMPTTTDLEYHALMSEEKAKFIDLDPVVVATRGKDAILVLRTVRAEMAKESAALHFQRVENEKFGKDTSQISTRRMEALNKIAAMEFEIKKLGADVIDLHGERFQRVFAFWIETLKEVAQATLAPEQADMLFNRLETTMNGWEDKASEAMASTNK